MEQDGAQEANGSASDEEWDANHMWIGKTILRWFPKHGAVRATVRSWLPPHGRNAALWHVRHADGEEEDLEQKDMEEGLNVYVTCYIYDGQHVTDVIQTGIVRQSFAPSFNFPIVMQ